MHDLDKQAVRKAKTLDAKISLTRDLTSTKSCNLG